MTDNRRYSDKRYYGINDRFYYNKEKERKVNYDSDKISFREQNKIKEKEIQETAETITNIERDIGILKTKCVNLGRLVEKFPETASGIHNERSILDEFMDKHKHDKNRRGRANVAFGKCTEIYGLIKKYKNHIESMNKFHEQIHESIGKAHEYIEEIKEKDKKPGGYLTEYESERIADLATFLVKYSREVIEIKKNHEKHTLDKKTLWDLKKETELPQDTLDMFADKKRFQKLKG